MIDSKNFTPEFCSILDTAIAQGASDIHLTSGTPPMLRIDTILRPLDVPVYTAETVESLVAEFIGKEKYDGIKRTKAELDFAFSYKSLRFRSNVYFQRGCLSASLRILPNKVRSLEELGASPELAKLLEKNQGLLIISGPTGHGKSTTLAAMVRYISEKRRAHIVTIEDPIEYLLENKKSIISQREVGIDTFSFASALRSTLREDADVVLLGEIRDLESIEVAMQIAETGHLVLTTLHTNSAAQTADRIVDVFPTYKQDQIRVQLSEVLIGICSQRLIPKISGGRVLVNELLIVNPAVRALIREGKTYQLPNLIQTSLSEGMVSLDRSLADLVIKGEISIDDAMAWSLDPKSLKTLIY